MALLSPGGGHPEDRGRWEGLSGGDSAGREEPLSASRGWLPEGCSRPSVHQSRLDPGSAGGEQVGKSPAEMSLPQAIMQSDK